MRHRLDQAIAQRVVRNDQDADHGTIRRGSILDPKSNGSTWATHGASETCHAHTWKIERSAGSKRIPTSRFGERAPQAIARMSASANIPPTSNPDCSAISTKHVGLVTLT